MLFSVLASSAVGLAGLLIAAPAPVEALVAPGSGSELGHLAARRLAGVSPNHNALARRKGNAHKKRQRCQQRPVSSSTPAPQQTGSSDYSGGNDGSGDYTPPDTNNYNNNNPVNASPSIPTVTPPVTTPPVVTQPSAPSTGGNKLILAWPNGGDQSITNSDFFTGKAAYYYTWSPYRVPDDGGIQFCPMLWGDNQIPDFTKYVVQGYATCVMGMNEVNQQGQAWMNTNYGAQLWDDHIGRTLPSLGYSLLVSPSTTSAPDGLDWIVEWLGLITTAKPNVIAVHWYDVGAENFKNYVTNFHMKTGQRNIWVTEFACQNFNGGAQCSQQEIWDLVTQVTSWMDGTDWITGYAPFGFMKDMQNVNDLNRLMNYDGHPTDLGYFFIHNS